MKDEHRFTWNRPQPCQPRLCFMEVSVIAFASDDVRQCETWHDSWINSQWLAVVGRCPWPFCYPSIWIQWFNAPIDVDTLGIRWWILKQLMGSTKIWTPRRSDLKHNGQVFDCFTCVWHTLPCFQMCNSAAKVAKENLLYFYVFLLCWVLVPKCFSQSDVRLVVHSPPPGEKDC